MLFRKSLAECSVESPSTLLAYGALASIAARSACRPDADDKTSCAAGAWHGCGLVCYARSSEGMGESPAAILQASFLTSLRTACGR
jgi:hypothetical protein